MSQVQKKRGGGGDSGGLALKDLDVPQKRVARPVDDFEEAMDSILSDLTEESQEDQTKKLARREEKQQRTVRTYIKDRCVC